MTPAGCSPAIATSSRWLDRIRSTRAAGSTWRRNSARPSSVYSGPMNSLNDSAINRDTASASAGSMGR